MNGLAARGGGGPEAARRTSPAAQDGDLVHARRYATRFGAVGETGITAAQVAAFEQLTLGQLDLLHRQAFPATFSWRWWSRSGLRLLVRCGRRLVKYLSTPGVGEALIVSTGFSYVMLQPYHPDTPSRDS